MKIDRSKYIYFFIIATLMFSTGCKSKRSAEELQSKIKITNEIKGQIEDWNYGSKKVLRLIVQEDVKSDIGFKVNRLISESKISEDGEFSLRNFGVPDTNYLYRISDKFPVQYRTFISDPDAKVSDIVSELYIANASDNISSDGEGIKNTNSKWGVVMPGDFYIFYIFCDRNVLYRGQQYIYYNDTKDKKAVLMDINLKLARGWNVCTFWYENNELDQDLSGSTTEQVLTSKCRMFSGGFIDGKWQIAKEKK